MASEPLFEKIESSFFKKYRWIFVVCALLLSTVIGALLLDLKLSTGGDDSAYILAAKKFINGESFPDWHGSFYPVFLGFFIQIFGLNIFMLKMLSFIMIVGQIFMIYIAFRQRTQWSIVLLVTLFTSVCFEILYFGGQTYSESLFMFIQISVFAAFFKLYDSLDEAPKANLSKHWKEWFVFGFLTFLLTQTRNVGWSMMIAIVLYFALEKKYYRLLYSVVSFLIFYIPYNVYKKVFWSVSGAGFEQQFNKILWINPYNANDGIVGIGGLINRVWENANIYFSKYFFIILGIKETYSTNALITVIFIVVLIAAAIVLFKSRKYLFFVVIYVYTAILVTFITQQEIWDQIRLISVYVPLILIIIFTALWDFLQNKKLNKLIPIIPVLLIAVITPSVIKSVDVAKKHYPILKANIQGDKYYGYTDDWKNYLKIAEWAGENISTDYKIGCRVPGIAYIYGNERQFEGIYSAESKSLNDVISFINKDSSNYHYAVDYNAYGDNFYVLFPFLKYISVVVNKDLQKQYVLFSLTKQKRDEFFTVLYNADLKAVNEDDFKNILSSTNDDDYAIFPDSLLNYLQSRQIKFLIAASFRSDPDENNGNIVNTIHRYIYFLEIKYPGIFNLEYQSGSNDQEPAMIFKINYGKTK